MPVPEKFVLLFSSLAAVFFFVIFRVKKLVLKIPKSSPGANVTRKL